MDSCLRLGSGGALAPDHTPLMPAEGCGAPAAPHSGRTAPGIGRGPGTFDEPTARALRRGGGPATDDE